MRNRVGACLVCFVFLAATCHAQIGSWQAVQSLSRGTRIEVWQRYQGRFECRYLAATTEDLTCSRPTSGRFSVPMVFPRITVRQVTVIHPHEAKALLGGVIGAGSGAAVGYNTKGSGTLTRGGRALLFGAAGGIIGYVAGDEVGKSREVIYRTR